MESRRVVEYKREREKREREMDAQIVELHQKLAIERKVWSGASAMLSKLTDENARQTCQVNVIESQRRIDFLQSELARLSLASPSPVLLLLFP